MGWCEGLGPHNRVVGILVNRCVLCFLFFLSVPYLSCLSHVFPVCSVFFCMFPCSSIVFFLLGLSFLLLFLSRVLRDIDLLLEIDFLVFSGCGGGGGRGGDVETRWEVDVRTSKSLHVVVVV